MRRRQTARRRRLTIAERLYGIGGGSAPYWLWRGYDLAEATRRESTWITWSRSDEGRAWRLSDGRDGSPPPWMDEALGGA